MNKTLKIVGIVLAVLVVLGSSFFISLKQDNIKLKEFNEVDLSKYLEIINKDEKSIILVARPGCTFCQKFYPVLKQAMSEMDLTVNYINTDDLSESEWGTFTNSLTYLSQEEWGTPLTLIVKNGQVIDSNNGYVDLQTIKSFFEKNGLGK